MKILITGIAGFIGSHVAEHLAHKGHHIIGVDNLSRKNFFRKNIIKTDYNWNYLKKFKNIELIKADITNFKDLSEKINEKIDVIFHAAAQVAVTTSILNPRIDFNVNVVGTFNILELARKFDSKVIFTSTNKVYGENVNKIPIKELKKRYIFISKEYENGIPENFPVDLTFHSPYGSSKLAADIYVQDYSYAYNIPTAVLRLSCIYGERQFGVEDQGWVAWFIIATITNQEITIYGNGKQVRDVLYIKDLVNLIDLLISYDFKKSKVYNIGGGPKNSVSILEFLDILEQELNKTPKIKFASWRHADQYIYISNIKKVKEELKWEPKINIKEGIRNIIKWINFNFDLFKLIS